ncbi:MAG: exodeoxyribonuclease VII large subunit, partial [Candidatus Hydrothermarchaeales archaeon]
QEPVPISSITPENIGSRVYVKGEVSGLRTSPQGHMFFMLSDDAGGIKVVVFKDVAKELGCIEEGRSIELRGVVDEYHGEIEVIPAKAADVRC